MLYEKCKKEPKLFNRFINRKIKHKEIVALLKENTRV